jgi:hypothetical protein
MYQSGVGFQVINRGFPVDSSPTALFTLDCFLTRPFRHIGQPRVNSPSRYNEVERLDDGAPAHLQALFALPPICYDLKVCCSGERAGPPPGRIREQHRSSIHSRLSECAGRKLHSRQGKAKPS